MSKKGRSRPLARSHLTLGIVLGLLVLTPLIFSVALRDVSAQSSGGTGGDFDSSAGGSGPPSSLLTNLTDLASGGGAQRGYFHYTQDNTRRHWRWVDGEGWIQNPTEETYQKGWHWTWIPNEGWQWGQSASDVVSTEPPSSIAPTSDTTVPGCFAGDGSWVTTGECAPDQATYIEAATAESPESLMDRGIPEAVASALYFARPMTAVEHSEVKAAMHDSFMGESVLARLRSETQKRASEALRRIITYKDFTKDSTLHTLLESRGEEALHIQRDIANAKNQYELEDAAARLRKLLGFTSQEVATFSSKDVSTFDREVLQKNVYDTASHMLAKFPGIFEAIEEFEISANDLRRMHDDMVRNFVVTRTHCETQKTDCARVRDTVEQVEKIMSLIGQIIADARNPVLRARVESALAAPVR